jgi:hypothetical protein
MQIRPTHSASRTLALQLPISIPDLVTVSHLTAAGHGVSRNRFVGAVSDEVRCVARLWQTDEV